MHKKFSGKLFNAGDLQEVTDALPLEEALQIYINHIPFSITMRTPGADRQLVHGLLFTEGLLVDLATDLKFDEVNLPIRGGIGMNVTVDPAALQTDPSKNRSLLATAACGMCGRRDIGDDLYEKYPPLKANAQIDTNLIPELMECMRKQQKSFDVTGGTHAAAAFSSDGVLLACYEDIGRHNAVDKVIGDLLSKEILKDATYLTISGRVSFEIVAKAYRGGIPCLTAVSAPSSLGVEAAQNLGITLVGFCRQARGTIYTQLDDQHV